MKKLITFGLFAIHQTIKLKTKDSASIMSQLNGTGADLD